MNKKNKIKELTTEEYNKHKDNLRFLSDVAFAHGVEGWEDYNKALCYYYIGDDFKVSSKIQNIAKEDYKKAKSNIIKSIKVNELVFVGMGIEFEPKDKEHIGNHRIRTYFEDNEENLCFVEFGSWNNKDYLRCDHALKNTKKNNYEWSSIKRREETEKRITILEGMRGGFKAYTKNNILKLVNKSFGTNFKSVRIYDYCLNTDDYYCISHKRN